MPATFQPFGFSLYSYEGGKTSYTSRTFPLASSSLDNSFGVGDAVTFTQSSPAGQGLAPLTNNAALTNYPPAYTVGIVEAIKYVTPQGQAVDTVYWAPNTPTMNNLPPIFTVNHLANSIFRVQCNTTLPATGVYGVNVNVMNNGNAVYTVATPTAVTGSVAPNPATGQSQQYLLTNSSGTGLGTGSSGGQVKIIGLAPTSTAFPTNNWTDLYPIVLVRFNLQFFSAPTPSTN